VLNATAKLSKPEEPKIDHVAKPEEPKVDYALLRSEVKLMEIIKLSIF